MKHNKKQRVFVGMSGGVDSSVAALLLSDSPEAKEMRRRAGLPSSKKGYEVTGVFMRCYNIDGCAEQDAEDARRVAEKIGIPFYVWDFEEDYKKKVVDYMVNGYKKGITPNPDVMCNREIKFGLFLSRALKMGADYVATGHYVRILKDRQISSVKFKKKSKTKTKNSFCLRQAQDTNKDQSYFLWTLGQEQLKHCLFPIGGYLKPEVREIARKAGLSTAEKKDSQGICFLGMVSMEDFLAKYIPKKRGPVLDGKGNKIGEHEGAHFYTIGQRQGIGNIKHQKGNRVHVPVYVAKKDVKRNTITVAEGLDNSVLSRTKINLFSLNLINSKALTASRPGFRVMARVRYRQPVAPAVLFLRSKDKAEIIFKEPQKFVAEGQSAVFYDRKGNMLGGGVIA